MTGGLTFATLSANRYTCGLTQSGVAYCWGHNADGELGIGSTTNSVTPVKIAEQP